MSDNNSESTSKHLAWPIEIILRGEDCPIILFSLLLGAVSLCKHISIQLIPKIVEKLDKMNIGVEFEKHFMVKIVFLHLDSYKSKN